MMSRPPHTGETPFDSYWTLRAARESAASLPRPVLRSFEAPGLDETEALFWGICRTGSSILDIGAGDNRIKRKFFDQGYAGTYKTCDLSTEFHHDFHSIEEITGAYDRILLLEVIEHLSLEQFYGAVKRVEGLLTKNGTIIVSTPNPACINPMWAGDMTHVQQYPLNDLLAFFMLRGFTCEGYRVVYTRERLSLPEQFRLLLKKVLVTKIIGVDYADGLIVIARRSSAG